MASSETSGAGASRNHSICTIEPATVTVEPDFDTGGITLEIVDRDGRGCGTTLDLLAAVNVALKMNGAVIRLRGLGGGPAMTAAAEFDRLLAEERAAWAAVEAAADGFEADRLAQHAMALSDKVLAARPSDPTSCAALLRWFTSDFEGHNLQLDDKEMLDHVAARLEAMAASMAAEENAQRYGPGA